jgi:molybdate transport system permease protein
MNEFDFTPFVLSFKLAGITSLLLFCIALPLAWYLSQTQSKSKPFIEALSALPIVLPPSVIGFYILVMLSPNSSFGKYLLDTFDVKLVFSFSGLVVASMIYSFPFMLQPLQNGFESLHKNMLEASYISGKGKLATLFFVALPNIKPSVLSALVITFAHTVGEFGVVLMIGGNIDGETKVASVAIYEMVEMLEYDKAHIYSAIMVAISFVTLFSVYIFNQKQKQSRFV